MVESRWIRRAGPGIATLGALGLVAATTLGVAGRSWSPPPCAGPPAAPAVAERVGASAWYREDPVLRDGRRVGGRISLGRADLDQPQVLAVDAESFAAGPFGDTLLVGTDDGRASALSLVDLERACAWPVATSAAVIRRATISPDGTSIYEIRVDRATRADLGIWRRPLAGDAEPVPVLGPLPDDERFGRTFITDFTWATDGRRLAVRSCGEVACRVRILDTRTGRHRLIADPRLGDVIGLGPDRLVVHGACRGLPCPVLSVPVRGGVPLVLARAGGLATMTTVADGSARVVVEVIAGAGRTLASIRPDGRSSEDLGPLPAGQRLVPSGGRAASGLAVPPGWVALGRDGRVAADGGRSTIALDIDGHRVVSLAEVPR